MQQYTVLESEARNVWDSVKAAQQIDETEAGDDMVVLGWFQGGGASVWMSQKTEYGEPLNLLGTAALAPAGDNGPQCVNHLAYVINSNLTDYSSLLQPSIPEDWQKRLNENTAGYSAPLAPVLVMQGTADTVVNPNGTSQYYERACGFGEPVQYTIYEGATHQTIPRYAKGEYVSWIADRFAGEPAPTTCGPVGSTQTPPAPIPRRPRSRRRAHNARFARRHTGRGLPPPGHPSSCVTRLA